MASKELKLVVRIEIFNTTCTKQERKPKVNESRAKVSSSWWKVIWRRTFKRPFYHSILLMTWRTFSRPEDSFKKSVPIYHLPTIYQISLVVLSKRVRKSLQYRQVAHESSLLYHDRQRNVPLHIFEVHLPSTYHWRFRLPKYSQIGISQRDGDIHKQHRLNRNVQPNKSLHSHIHGGNYPFDFCKQYS